MTAPPKIHAPTDGIGAFCRFVAHARIASRPSEVTCAACLAKMEKRRPPWPRWRPWRRR